MAGTSMPMDRRFQSTLPSRGATRVRRPGAHVQIISIHAPLAGSDPGRICGGDLLHDFNPRSPRGERHAQDKAVFAHHIQFQSTLPSRGATFGSLLIPLLIVISIHAPLAGSDILCGNFCVPVIISIHAPLAGSDSNRYNSPLMFPSINPRSPRGERRSGLGCLPGLLNFNPRSPRGERLGIGLAVIFWRPNFNPRSPRGERQQI